MLRGLTLWHGKISANTVSQKRQGLRFSEVREHPSHPAWHVMMTMIFLQRFLLLLAWSRILQTFSLAVTFYSKRLSICSNSTNGGRFSGSKSQHFSIRARIGCFMTWSLVSRHDFLYFSSSSSGFILSGIKIFGFSPLEKASHITTPKDQTSP